MLKRIFSRFCRKEKYNRSFVYKWGFLAGLAESLLVFFGAFSLLNIYEIYRDFEIFQNSSFALLPIAFFLVIFLILTFIVVFGMPIFLIFEKKLFSIALLVLLMTLSTLFVVFTFLFLFLSI